MHPVKMKEHNVEQAYYNVVSTNEVLVSRLRISQAALKDTAATLQVIMAHLSPSDIEGMKIVSDLIDVNLRLLGGE